MQSNAEVSPAAHAAEDVVLHLRVLNKDRQEIEVVTRVGVDTVDLSAHTGLLALPEALRGLTAIQELMVVSTALKMLPEWLGELRTLEILRVGGKVDDNFLEKCPLCSLPGSIGALTGLKSLHLRFLTLTALPESLGALTGLVTLDLQNCLLKVLPASLGSLTALISLDLGTCHALTALPASLGALTGLTTLNLNYCWALMALPESLGALTLLKILHLPACWSLTALPASLRALTSLTTLDLRLCEVLTVLPESLGALTRLTALNLSNCSALMALPQSLGALTGLKTLDLVYCESLTALPASLGTLTALTIYLLRCSALHTPPPSIVEAGPGAVLQFLRDLAKGEAPTHLIKVMLLGDQHAGKSSLADSLVLGQPATRADNDRTVSIEVRRWRLGGQSQLVANIFDAAGQHVYRATHGFFMSSGALFLHVVRCDMPEDAAVAALLEWVEAVRQEAPGAVMGIVWTHTDFFTDGVCGGADGQEGFLRVVGSAGGDTTSWIAMRYALQQFVGAPCVLKDDT